MEQQLNIISPPACIVEPCPIVVRATVLIAFAEPILVVIPVVTYTHVQWYSQYTSPMLLSGVTLCVDMRGPPCGGVFHAL